MCGSQFHLYAKLIALHTYSIALIAVIALIATYYARAVHLNTQFFSFRKYVLFSRSVTGLNDYSTQICSTIRFPIQHAIKYFVRKITNENEQPHSLLAID